MENERHAEFMGLIVAELPSARLMELQERGLDTLWGVMVSGVKIGDLAALWKVFDAWTTHHANASVRISYRDADDTTIEVTYTRLTKRKAEELLASHPPLSERPIKLILEPDKDE